jgi:cobalt-zinc-cadmium efflux system membrane fusion protein
MSESKSEAQTPEPADQTLPARKTKLLRRLYAAIAAGVLLVIMLGAVLAHRKDGKTAEAQAAGPPASRSSDTIEPTPDQLAQLQVESVREELIDVDLTTTGKVGFNEDRLTPVFAPYGGRVLEVLANKGELVAVGQPLLVVESPDLVSAVNDFAEAHTNEDKAKIALDIAEKAAQRARNLNSLEALATKELQAAESDLARARDDYRRAVAAVSVVRNRLALFGKSVDEIKQLEEPITDQLDRRIIIRAPLAGTIVDRKVGPGQYVKPDTPDPLYLIGDLSNVWVNADVYETYLPQIHIGASVEITVPAYADKTFPARISAINPTVDAATRTIHVRCSVPNAAGLLKPEMFASIRISSAAKRKVSAIPSTAVLTQGNESFVLAEDSIGRFRKRRVKPVREAQGYTVVEDGLAGCDRVVTRGALLLSDMLAGK